MPHLVQMDKRYSKKGLHIVAPEVQGSSVEAIEEIVKNEKMKFTVTKGISGPSLTRGIPHAAVFDVSGKVDAALMAQLTVDALLVSFDDTFELARVELVNCELPLPDGFSFRLAEQIGGTLNLNVGPRASLRSDVFTETDEAETLTLRPGGAPGSVVVEGFGRVQEYDDVTRVVGDGGDFDDMAQR